MKTIWQRPIAALTVSGALLFGSVAIAATEPAPVSRLSPPSHSLQLAEAAPTGTCSGDEADAAGCDARSEKRQESPRGSAQQRFYQRMLMLLRLLNPQA